MANLFKDSSKSTIALLNEDLFGEDDSAKKPVSKALFEKETVFDFPEGLSIQSSEETQESESPIQMELTDNAIKVLERRYLKKNENGEVIETPTQLFRRVASFIAQADLLYDPAANVKKTESVFYSMMANLEFMPNSPTLMNAGRDLQQLSACFVLPVGDSMDSIFDAVKYTALIHKSGGGTGFSFSQIRPQNDIVRSTKGIASGPISFMHVFDEATETVKQGGTRRGANMAILRIDHPDILEFIRAKEDSNKLNNFNISVSVTETFWKALEENRDYDVINPHSGEKTGSLKAKNVFDEIVQHAWSNGDPGIVFIDRINRDNPTPQLGAIESTNPCGEQPLLPFESCNLGSINLTKMIKKTGDKIEVDYDKLLRTVRTSVHFLDNVIDMNKFPLPQIEKMTKNTRKIGLGVMGFSDMLIQLDMPYNSNEAIDLATTIMQFINAEAKKKSQELAVKRGEFPAFPKSVFGQRGEPKLRNSTRTTIAPTGTISIIAGCSSGIEPLYALSFTRHVMDDDKLPEIHPLFLERMKKEGLYTEEIIRKVGAKGSVEGMEEIPEPLRNVFVTAHEVSPEWHIRMQAAFQCHTDNAVSKTVNFSNKTTAEDVAKVYRLAHDLGCKGVTIYRDGSREKQVLNKGLSQKAEDDASTVKIRPRVLHGFTTKLNTGQGSLYVTINMDEASAAPVEVFANIGKSGGDTAALAEAIGRLISIALQKGVSVEEVSQTLMGITGSRPIWNEGILVKSVPDGIGQILLNEFGKKKAEDKPHVSTPHTVSFLRNPPEEKKHAILGLECPECSSLLESEGGCNICRGCGYSHCG